MNKKGFTLVELMVVIVIIGILAAVAAPKLSDNINSARCNEVPKNFKKLIDKAVEMEANSGEWPTVIGSGDGEVDVNVTSTFWTYAITSTATAEAIVFSATNAKKIGPIAIGDAVVTANNEGAKTVSADGALLKTKYMKAYLTDASQL